MSQDERQPQLSRASGNFAALTSLPCPVLQDSQLLQEEFGLATSEELLERFPCSMLQTYTCLHNPFTPNQQVCPG